MKGQYRNVQYNVLTMKTIPNIGIIKEIVFQISGKKRYSIEIPVPILSKDRKYIIYNNSVYGNIIFGCPPKSSRYGIPKINNTIDGLNQNFKIHELYMEPNTQYTEIGSFYKICYRNKKSTVKNIFLMDNWEYIDSYTLLEEMLILAIEKSIDYIKILNTISTFILNQFVNNYLSLFRYICNVSIIDTYKYQIIDTSNTVIIPPIFTNLPKKDIMKKLKSSFIDFTDCSQSKMFTKFSLKEGFTIENRKD